MLSDEDKARIRQEEEARIQQFRQQQEEHLRQHAAEAYRNEIRQSLSPPRKKGWPVFLVSGGLIMALAGGFYLWSQRPTEPPAQSLVAFVQQCKWEVEFQCNCSASFPPDTEAAQQVVDLGEERSWQGYYEPQYQADPDFLCSGNASSDEVHVEIFREDL